MSAARRRVLVVGAGSIGRRHLGILAGLGRGLVLAAAEPDAALLAAAVEATGAQPFSSYDAALAAFRPDAVLVCTPPVLHVEQARAAVAAGADVFVEKPLAASLDGIDALAAEARAAGRVVQIGYNLHFDRALEHVKRLLDEGAVGRIAWGHVEFGQWLPDWRPARDYRTTYTARRELGGGILLDASHELAYALWLLGDPVRAVSLAGKVSALEVDVEDCATVLLRFASGAHCDVHVDFVRRHLSRTCTLAGELGTIDLDLIGRTVRLRHVDGRDHTWSFPAGDNDDYTAELEHFLDCCDTRAEPRNGLTLARRALVIALEAGAGITAPVGRLAA